MGNGKERGKGRKGREENSREGWERKGEFIALKVFRFAI